MDLLEIFLGQIPEAIYFALFMIFAKDLKEKRILYILLMVIEYLLLKHFIKYNIWFQILYTIMQFVILKVLYKEKSQITDIFTFTIASIILVLCCFIPSLLFISNMNNYTIYLIYVVITRILMFGFLFIFKNKLNNIQKVYKKLWNRNDKINKKIKSTTFRSLNIVVFNIIFYVIHLGMIYTIFLRK